jgi:endonuclease YncB( thermonuclease family)
MKQYRLQDSFLLCAFILIAATPGLATTITGKVVRVTNGAALTVLDAANKQHEVRLTAIDAPADGQAFGQASQRSLSDLVFGRIVSVRYTSTNRYGQVVGLVTCGGKDINLAQLKAGLAWFYRTHSQDIGPTRRELYDRTEREARAAKRGLWIDPNPQTPWEFNYPDAAGAKSGKLMSAQRGGKIIADRNSMIYQAPDCPDYSKVSERNRVLFNSEAEAVKAGYRKARNCP